MAASEDAGRLSRIEEKDEIRRVIDINRVDLSLSLKAMLEGQLLRTDGQQRRLPSALISDDMGIQLWSQITYLPEHYYTTAESRILEEWGADIAQDIVAGSTIIDLGAGDVRKVKLLLDRLEASEKTVQYYALDLSRAALEKSLKQLPDYRFVKCSALWGTFADAFAWSKTVSGPKFFLSLGAIFGNDKFDIAVTSLAEWANLLRPQDRMLISIDSCKDSQRVWNSYNDSQGVWHAYIRNGFARSNQILNQSWYRPEDWEITGVCSSNEDPIRHLFEATAVRPVKCEPLNFDFPVGEKIVCYECFKYDAGQMREIFSRAGLKEEATWRSSAGFVDQYLLSKSPSNDSVKDSSVISSPSSHVNGTQAEGPFAGRITVSA